MDISENDKEQRTRDVAVHEVRKMMFSQGWKYLNELWMFERMKIEHQGKKRRSVELAACDWARLDGFDAAVELASKITNSFEVEENLVMEGRGT